MLPSVQCLRMNIKVLRERTDIVAAISRPLTYYTRSFAAGRIRDAPLKEEECISIIAGIIPDINADTTADTIADISASNSLGPDCMG